MDKIDPIKVGVDSDSLMDSESMGTSTVNDKASSIPRKNKYSITHRLEIGFGMPGPAKSVKSYANESAQMALASNAHSIK